MLRKLFFILCLIAAIYFAYQFAKNKNWLPKNLTTKIDARIPQKINFPWQKTQKMSFEQKDFEKLGENSLNQIKILASKAKEAGTIAQEFVQEVVKEDKGSEKNVSEKAFDYGRYIYCQEVVKQYEASSSSLKF